MSSSTEHTYKLPEDVGFLISEVDIDDWDTDASSNSSYKVGIWLLSRPRTVLYRFSSASIFPVPHGYRINTDLVI